MSFSLNEVEATTKKAARGAGYDWGLAEEAGKAARWLCAHGLDGVAHVAHLLTHGYADKLDQRRPQSLSSPWTGHSSLCPLITGATLSDCATCLPAEIGRITAPVILLPFIASAARQTDTAITVEMDGFSAWTDGHALSLAGEPPAETARLVLKSGAAFEALQPLQSRAHPAPDAWITLDQLAQRTYAPATDESRRLGAGAGLSDND